MLHACLGIVPYTGNDWNFCDLSSSASIQLTLSKSAVIAAPPVAASCILDVVPAATNEPVSVSAVFAVVDFVSPPG